MSTESLRAEAARVRRHLQEIERAIKAKIRWRNTLVSLARRLKFFAGGGRRR